MTAGTMAAVAAAPDAASATKTAAAATGNLPLSALAVALGAVVLAVLFSNLKRLTR